MSYQVEFSKRAAKQFKALSLEIQLRLSPKIDALADEPRPSGMVKLTGEKDLYRIRVGDYRVVYRIEDENLIVLIIKLGHRSDIYR
ncbi:type II toxin-antitoxin system RelE/ParE family toxin [Leptolyngbya sp. FACHB-17]|uniref:type II toxin-antitoxin system RelE family toxin n=1 Tax=unclassified Leptolyngbya TaxID=2650499 RepID=UPI0016804FD9|nr:type II toxin-antitoxin system RelE/ParE family toxin [Leptolyngbya sp. FACHB-17]MBD2082817.1 type II toxin-antitoxin system RelE/ParE family toxin [Leptolyngbya sp. FACHB-17]